MNFFFSIGAANGTRPPATLCLQAASSAAQSAASDRALLDDPPGHLTTFAPSRVRVPLSGHINVKGEDIIRYLLLLIGAANGTRTRTPCGHKHLKLACLPIPAQPQIAIKDYSIIILLRQGFVNEYLLYF